MLYVFGVNNLRENERKHEMKLHEVQTDLAFINVKVAYAV